MNESGICFIICTNNETFLAECLVYLNRLMVPEGIQTEIITIKDASSMLSGYKEACRQTDALYKVFLHQDVFILNRHFIQDMISIFSSDPDIGIIGMAGCKRIPESFIMWAGERAGSLFVGGRDHDYENYSFELTSDGLDEVEAVDGLLMAVKGEAAFRDDIFDGWDFYDLSMSLEMRSSGKKLVVPRQRLPWCLHDDGGVLSMLNYDKYRQRAMKLYGKSPLTIMLTGGLVTLDEFVRDMAKGTEAYIADTKSPEKTLLPLMDQINEETVVITFNNVGSGFLLWKQRRVQLYNILVDHPAHFLEAISEDYYPGYHAVLIDRGHQAFLKEVFGNTTQAFHFMPHGGTRIDCFPQDKDIDILYLGGFKAEDEINFQPLPFGDSEAFYDFVIDYYERENYVEAQNAVKAYIEASGLDYSSPQAAVMTNYIVRSAEAFFVSKRRKELIEYLAEEGFIIHICGNEVWRETAGKYPGNIVYEGMKAPGDCHGYIARAKVLINDLPYFSDGSHERVFNGMLNGAVVLSNESRYLEERFRDGESILFWDGRDYSTAADKIRRILTDDGYRDSIVKTAMSLTERDTWRDRFDRLISGSV